MYWFIPIDSEVKILNGNFDRNKLIVNHQKIYKNINEKNIFCVKNFLNSDKIVNNNFLKKFDLDILSLKENLEKISDCLEIFNESENNYNGLKVSNYTKVNFNKNIEFDIKAYCNDDKYCECDSISNDLLDDKTSLMHIYYNNIFMTGIVLKDKINLKMFPELELIESLKIIQSNISNFKEKVNSELYLDVNNLKKKVNSLKSEKYTPINYEEIKKLFFKKFTINKVNQKPKMFNNILNVILSSINKEDITENLKEYYKRVLLKIIRDIELDEIKLDNNVGYVGIEEKDVNKVSLLKQYLNEFQNESSKIPIEFFNEKLVQLENNRNELVVT